MSHVLELRGCTPEPLMAYLKALGIFRLVAEQKDKYARAWWRNDTFMLKSVLDRDGLVDFLLHEYKPTPIVSPWNGGSGFYPKDNSKAMEAILELESPRFQLWNEVVSIGKGIVSRGEGSDKKTLKEWTLAKCRAEFPDDALDWLDATYVLTAYGARFPPLLGTGGNDGRLEFSNNFMQNVVSTLNIDDRRNGASVARSRLIAALFNEGSPQLMKKRSTGFYNPGSVGGANASVGFNDDALTNPWDYVLMFEGVLLFAGAAARRLSSQTSSKAVFPFTVDSSAAGYGTSADSEYGDSSRAEFWAPLWDQPTKIQELNHLVSEGRAQMGRRQGANGTDFARAVIGLGTERGVRQFQRYGFMVRNGLAYLAAPLGRFDSPDHEASERVNLANVLFDLDGWLNSLRRNASSNRAPSGLGTILREIEDEIVEFCQRGGPHGLQDVLIAVGRAERWVASSGLRENVGPLRNLTFEWLEHANDNSVEFRLARAMSSILRDPIQEIGPIRWNLEPVATPQQLLEWDADSTSFVWTAGEPLRNMLAVLERRCLEVRMNGAESRHPPLSASYYAQLSDIVSFLSGHVDDQRMADLSLPLSFVRNWHRSTQSELQQVPPFDLPVAYAAMKLTLLPDEFKCLEFGPGVDIAMEPSMLAMLRAGRVGSAYQMACRRLRASGLRPLSEDPGIRDGSEQGRRLAAALLFPLDKSAHCALAQRALLRPDRREPGLESE
ncbi:MAG: type I-U CRISPR-associated protein Csx17 [Chloroflexi bacterium]|nr:type I-U CRISPR-associated protein Csx17 [Chloroflexota bacterium]